MWSLALRVPGSDADDDIIERVRMDVMGEVTLDRLTEEVHSGVAEIEEALSTGSFWVEDRAFSLLLGVATVAYALGRIDAAGTE